MIVDLGIKRKGMLSDYVWYASYGSNLLRNRFHCYIQGGVPMGSSKIHIGCRDKSLPLQEKNIIINRELYFAKNKSSWGKGGVAFIKPEEDTGLFTFGKMYLITKEQFWDVVCQENDMEFNLEIKFDKVIENNQFQIFEKAWYDMIVFLGYEASWPVFTFTHHEFLNDELCPAHSLYMKSLTDGLRESYGLSSMETEIYFRNRGGYENTL